MSHRHSSCIEFPTAGNEPRLNSVKVTAYRDSHKQTKAILFERSAEVKQILFTTQNDENIDDLQIDIKIQFEEQNFLGTSYGLALAIASKQARLSETGKSKRIVATGVIGPDCNIQAVEAFEQKLSLINQNLEKGDLFIYPKANLQTNQLLQDQIDKLPCQTCAVNHLSELSYLWGATNQDETKIVPQKSTTRTFFRGLIYGVLSVLIVSMILIFTV